MCEHFVGGVRVCACVTERERGSRKDWRKEKTFNLRMTKVSHVLTYTGALDPVIIFSNFRSVISPKSREYLLYNLTSVKI